MDPGEAGGVQRDAGPGMSAVLAAYDDHVELEGAVLDLAAVLDGLVSEHFEIIVVELVSARLLTEQLAEVRLRHPDLPLRLISRVHTDQGPGLSAAFESAAYDLILVTTLDGQFEVRESNHLLEAIERGADLATGYRARRADGLVRRAQGWGWNALVRLMFGPTGRDVDCPVRLFRRAVWLELGMRSCEPKPIFDAEFLIRARRLGFSKVVEVPLSHRRPASPDTWRPWGPSEIVRRVVDLLELRRGLHLRQPLAEKTARRVPSGRQAA